MILIDAIYICQTGGKNLLDTLIGELDRSGNEQVVILIDNRIKEQYQDKHYRLITLEFLTANEMVRYLYYSKNGHLFRKVLCLANVPPPMKLHCIVMIYFQNLLLFDRELQGCFPLKKRLLFRSKSFLIRTRVQKSQEWIVQTSIVSELLTGFLRISADQISEYPIYKEDIPEGIIRTQEKTERFFYPATDANHKNHVRLIRAWEQLFFEDKISAELHLTFPHKSNSALAKEILSLQKRGVSIINHGLLSKEEVNQLYTECRFVIHPSLGESFGLVLIEALKSRCILLAPDLPYVNVIVKPDYYFDPYSIDSIARSVKHALTGIDRLKSGILVENKTDSLINHLLS